MCTHPFAKKALTLHLARSEGHERYFGCNLMHRKVLASSHQHLIAEAPVGGTSPSRRRPVDDLCEVALCPSCPIIQTNSRLARRAVSIVIAPWRAPDLGRVGGDVGDFGSPYAQGKTRSNNGMPRSRAETWIQARADLDQNVLVLGQLRGSSPGLDSEPLG